MKVYPDYYKEFKCIGSECRHNCCIGWEIDIDSESAEFYKNVGGELGKRLEKGITQGDAPHFILGDGERCPFLNKHNLCDIITELGEEHLCDICREHPRFNSELPDRVEVGLGLTCEAAARIIVGKRTPFSLVGAEASGDEIILFRGSLLLAATDREKSIFERFEEVAKLAEVTLPEKNYGDFAQIFLDLERLDDEWTDRLKRLRDKGDTLETSSFAEYMREREYEYEQILCYFIYRHVAVASDMADARARAAFALFSCEMIFALGALFFDENGRFDFEDQVELCRTYSSEIEYSEENVYTLLELLNPDF